MIRVAHPAWRAILEGAPLTASSITEGDGPALQEFALPADAQGSLVVSIDDSARTRWLWAQAIAWLVVAVLALPARRSAGDDDADDDIDPDGDAANDAVNDVTHDDKAEEVTT